MLAHVLCGLVRALASRVRVGADPRRCAPGTLVILPRGQVTLACGIAALVEISRAGTSRGAPSPQFRPEEDAERVASSGIGRLLPSRGGLGDAERAAYAGGDETLDRLAAWARSLKRTASIASLATDEAARAAATAVAAKLRAWADDEEARLRASALPAPDLDLCTSRVLRARDAAWFVEREALPQADEALDLAAGSRDAKLLGELRRVTAVLRCIDRIEIRGRDSAGIAVQASFPDRASFERAMDDVRAAGLVAELGRRRATEDLLPGAVALSEGAEPCVTFVYKVAAEVGHLGDNVTDLRRQVRCDALLRAFLAAGGAHAVVLGHTRWASSGVISLPNCHPVDNASPGAAGTPRSGRVFVVMNGDVDNHLDLRAKYEAETGAEVSPRITTDTKVVALEVERNLRAGLGIDEAWSRACREFHGSCALGMVTDLAPGRLFLSLRGSGQSLYVGVSDDGWFASSEVYGVVEETPRYLKLDGEKDRVPGEFATRGQIVRLASSSDAGRAGLARSGFDGADLPVAESEVRTAEITTRDVDRGSFDHFFRKEITQSARSVARTLWGRVLRGEDGEPRLSADLLPPRVRERLASGAIRQMLVVGQGTAAVAGSGIAEYFRRIAAGSPVRAHALPATEMSGFHLRDDMSDTLVVAVTQSGSTADTNRAVDLARKRGALVAAVVNRRNSDITYRADAVVYTSDGRDVEMSVASTKAFYSQLTAGALLSLAVASEIRAAGPSDVAREIRELEDLPRLMQKVFDREDAIRAAAESLAPTRTHWAVVASGPNQVAGEEVRIKLSELCYKSISVDTVENKKHIDLSCEPLVLVLAAGNPESVLNDVVKDVAIFKAHKALPVVFAPEGDGRFAPYAAAVIPLPAAGAIASMVLCALAGHLFGYHAARSIDENARFLSAVRAHVVAALADESARESLPRTLAPFRRDYLGRLLADRFTSSLHPVTAVRLASLLDLAVGVSVDSPDTEALAGGPTDDVAAALVNALGLAMDECARPVDAIRHQAKIVTVGTSRPEEAMTGAVADALAAAGVDQDALVPVDMLDLRRIQPAIRAVAGLTRYSVAALRADGAPGPDTTVRVTDRRGVAAQIPSRADRGAPLSGTKRQVVADRRLFLGVGRGDGRRIAILPTLGADRHVTGLVLLHLDFHANLAREAKAALLGAKLERLRDVVAESNRTFDPSLLDKVTPEQIVVEDADDLATRVLATS
ncbi:MAG: hypothetical protein HMLKMBBP_03625 [Planctomycetes bacterium]|nr:hypothetical protein [Planctomycetota bacterium]